MKKSALVVCALLSTLSAFAFYGDDYGYSRHSDSMSGFAIFSLIVMIAYIILSIIILVRWWKMTSDIKMIKEQVTSSNPKITYLIATGETEQAKKAALKLLVDALYPVYHDPFNHAKADDMNKIISQRLPQIQRLSIEVPDYVTSGEKFIDYMNGLSGNKVVYRENAYGNPQ